MDLSSFIEPSLKIFLSINIDINIIVEVAGNQGIDDNSNKKSDCGWSVMVDLNDHSLGFEQDQQEQVKLFLSSMGTRKTVEKQLMPKQ